MDTGKSSFKNDGYVKHDLHLYQNVSQTKANFTVFICVCHEYPGVWKSQRPFFDLGSLFIEQAFSILISGLDHLCGIGKAESAALKIGGVSAPLRVPLKW